MAYNSMRKYLFKGILNNARIMILSILAIHDLMHFNSEAFYVLYITNNIVGIKNLSFIHEKTMIIV